MYYFNFKSAIWDKFTVALDNLPEYRPRSEDWYALLDFIKIVPATNTPTDVH